MPSNNHPGYKSVVDEEYDDLERGFSDNLGGKHDQLLGGNTQPAVDRNPLTQRLAILRGLNPIYTGVMDGIELSHPRDILTFTGRCIDQCAQLGWLGWVIFSQVMCGLLFYFGAANAGNLPGALGLLVMGSPSALMIFSGLMNFLVNCYYMSEAYLVRRSWKYSAQDSWSKGAGFLSWLSLMNEIALTFAWGYIGVQMFIGFEHYVSGVSGDIEHPYGELQPFEKLGVKHHEYLDPLPYYTGFGLLFGSSAQGLAKATMQVFGTITYNFLQALGLMDEDAPQTQALLQVLDLPRYFCELVVDVLASATSGYLPLVLVRGLSLGHVNYDTCFRKSAHNYITFIKHSAVERSQRQLLEPILTEARDENKQHVSVSVVNNNTINMLAYSQVLSQIQSMQVLSDARKFVQNYFSVDKNNKAADKTEKEKAEVYLNYAGYVLFGLIVWGTAGYFRGMLTDSEIKDIFVPLLGLSFTPKPLIVAVNLMIDYLSGLGMAKNLYALWHQKTDKNRPYFTYYSGAQRVFNALFAVNFAASFLSIGGALTSNLDLYDGLSSEAALGLALPASICACVIFNSYGGIKLIPAVYQAWSCFFRFALGREASDLGDTAIYGSIVDETHNVLRLSAPEDVLPELREAGYTDDKLIALQRIPGFDETESSDKSFADAQSELGMPTSSIARFNVVVAALQACSMAAVQVLLTTYLSDQTYRFGGTLLYYTVPMLLEIAVRYSQTSQSEVEGQTIHWTILSEALSSMLKGAALDKIGAVYCLSAMKGNGVIPLMQVNPFNPDSNIGFVTNPWARAVGSMAIVGASSFYSSSATVSHDNYEALSDGEVALTHSNASSNIL